MSAAPDAPATPSPVPSYHDDVDVTKYDEMLAEKVEALRAKFAPLLRIAADDETTDDETTELPVDVFPSPPKHFRSRCRFQVLAEKAVDAVPGAPGDGARRPALSYHLREDGTTTGAIDEFPMALESINRAMPRLLDAVADDASGELADGLEAVHFLAARGAGGMHVTLVYSRPIDADGKWRVAASRARERLLREIAPPAQTPRTASAGDPSGDAEGDTAFNLLGRSKGVSVLIGDANHVVERLRLRDGRVLAYHQPEGAFSNPNAFVAEHTVNWLRDVSAATAAPATRALRAKRRQSPEASGGEAHPTDRSPPTDPPLPSLLELYCGNGNHTVALASSFASVAAVELSAALCDAARANLARNGVRNARVFRAPSEAVARRALRRRRAGGANETSQKTSFDDDAADDCVSSLDVDAFDCVLVDPPRAGLDPDTLALVKKFDVVLYISCDPNSLFANATSEGGLAESHALRRFAVFDHFPYTRHIEVGAAWVRKA
jgi:tRNA (uracil-5-)-methyltransferase